MNVRLLRNAAFWSTLIVSAFNALSAIAGGIGMLATPVET